MCERTALAIMGGFGGGNLGDELIAQALSRLCENEKRKVVMWSFFKEKSSELNSHVQWLDYRDLPDTVQVLKNILRKYRRKENSPTMERVIFGAGGLFYDYQLLHLVGWFSRVRYFIKNEIPYSIFSQSLTEPKTRIGKVLLRYILKNAATVSFRDRQSIEIAKSLVSRQDFRLSRDPVFLLRDRIKTINTRPRINKVVLAIRPWAPLGDDGGLNYWVDIIGKLQAGGIAVGLAAFDPRIDLGFCESIQKFVGNSVEVHNMSGWESSDKITSVLAEYNGMVAMRFHAAVISFITELPCVGYSYDPKVRGLFSDAELDALVIDVGTKPKNVAEQIRQGFKEWEVDRRKLQARVKRYVLESESIILEMFEHARGKLS